MVTGTSHAIDLKQSKLTQVVNDVEIISAADQKQKAATINDVFSMPDILRTGAASRAELVAEDQTVTRVGANTIFSFDPAERTIDLKQGSLLFHAPHGKGGGTIHTGSATASVLGTTLIVTTTPHGGFKVIALEGQIEIQYLNGLKQKLNPGQMTFVLPGANQLAPVVIFRLDELTANSLLVRGFTQTLDSIPLIQNQIDKQLKLIQTGKVSDTGLYAGDNATPNQVEVLDINTITTTTKNKNTQQSPPVVPPNPPPVTPNLTAAEAADAFINHPSLLDPSITTPPDHVYLGSFSLSGIPYLSGQAFSGFVARNIFMNTLGLSPLEVDLSPYAGNGAFDMVSLNDFNFDGSVTFKGLSSSDTLGFIAGAQFNFTPGSVITADAKNVLFSSPAPLLFNDVSLFNLTQDITLNSAGDVTFQNNSLIDAGSRLNINSGGNVSATDSHLISGSAFFSSLDGSVTMENSVLDAANHVIFVAPNISLDNSVINSDFVTLNGAGNSAISLNNTTINGTSSILALSINDLNITGTVTPPVSEDSGVRTRAVASSIPSALLSDPSAGSVTLSSLNGSVNVSGTSISAHYLTLNSGDGILLDGNGQTFAAAGPGSTATFTAPNLITVNNADFSAFAVLNMAANTIVLNNDALAPISNFGTKTGQVNVNGAEIYGGLNLYNCSWQSTPITSTTQVTLSSGPGTTPGIYSYAR